MEFSFQELWSHTSTPVKVIIAMIFGMLIWCVYVVVERLIALGRARSQSRQLAGEIVAPLSINDAGKAIELAKQDRFKAAYLAHLVAAGLGEWAARPDRYGIEAAQRALSRTTITEGADLRKGMSVLATVGATAPFVGLVGTVIGIINAFRVMGSSKSVDLTTLAPAIGEALITTAVGIMVALCGVWTFNYFTARIEAITNDMDVSIQEIVDWCEKQLIARKKPTGGHPQEDPTDETPTASVEA